MRKDLQNAYHALLKGVVTIRVKFEAGGREYTYRALESDQIQVGDTVVIHFRNKFFTTDVVAVDLYPDFSKDVEYKWIVCKVDADRYNRFLDQEMMFEQQMLSLSAVKESQKVKNELIEQYGEENVGYLAAIAQGKVELPSLMDVIDLLSGQAFITEAAIPKANIANCITVSGNPEALAEAVRKAAEEGAQQGYAIVQGGARVNWESRYNKHIAALSEMGGMTWRDFMAIDKSTEDMQAVKDAKILFDRFKRKQYPIEVFVEEFKNKL